MHTKHIYMKYKEIYTYTNVRHQQDCTFLRTLLAHPRPHGKLSQQMFEPGLHGGVPVGDNVATGGQRGHLETSSQQCRAVMSSLCHAHAMYLCTLVSKGGKISVLELSCQVLPRSSLFIRIAPGFLAKEKAWTMRHKTNE